MLICDVPLVATSGIYKHVLPLSVPWLARFEVIGVPSRADLPRVTASGCHGPRLHIAEDTAPHETRRHAITYTIVKNAAY
jgi:hypothetical protein